MLTSSSRRRGDSCHNVEPEVLNLVLSTSDNPRTTSKRHQGGVAATGRRRHFDKFIDFLRSISHRQMLIAISMISMIAILGLSRLLFNRMQAEISSLEHQVARSKLPPTGLAITIGFNHNQDPQRPHKIKPTFDYIAPWYNSLSNFPEMKGIVLENMYDEEFRSTYSNSQVSFYHIDIERHPSFVNIPDSNIRSINDQRYFTIEEFLNERYKGSAEESHEYVVITDSHDVKFLKNPFELMRGMDAAASSMFLYIGEEYKPVPGAYQWNQGHWKSCFGDSMPYTTKILSAGIIGGHVSVVKRTLRLMNEMFLHTNIEADCNMNVLQRIVSSHFNNDVFSGFPLHTKFKEFEETSDAYIQHK